MSNESESSGSKRAEVPNPWPAPSAGVNPYLHNIFVLLGLDPDANEKDYERTRTRTANRLEANEEIVVHGHRLEQTDLSRAGGLTADVEGFVAERLLAHTHHKIDSKRFDQATKAIEAAPFELPTDLLPLAVRDLSFLTALLPEPSDVVAGEAVPVPQETLAELFRPDPASELVFDL